MYIALVLLLDLQKHHHLHSDCTRHWTPIGVDLIRELGQRCVPGRMKWIPFIRALADQRQRQLMAKARKWEAVGESLLGGL